LDRVKRATENTEITEITEKTGSRTGRESIDARDAKNFRAMNSRDQRGQMIHGSSLATAIRFAGGPRQFLSVFSVISVANGFTGEDE
jgi:hypothetical protein